MTTGFHGNKLLQNIVKQIIEKKKVSSFIETGTYDGRTTSFIAEHFDKLQIYSCDIDEKIYNFAKKALSKYKNVKLFLESSEKFIEKLLKKDSENSIGSLPMFFLDAHWYDYWPLKDEMKLITSLEKFIVLVDDFEVPGKPEFGNDNGGGGTIGVHRTTYDSRPCNIDLFSEYIPEGCLIGYPSYTKKEALSAGSLTHFRGHAFFIHGVEIDDIKENSFYKWNL